MKEKWLLWWVLGTNAALGVATIYRIWGYFQ